MYRDNFQNSSPTSKEFVTVSRVTALWAFSEAALGGVLHALKIPFTGLFIGGSAVIFLMLIAHFSSRKSLLIQSTLVVILIKGIVSPYTPLNAYFAVFLQGIFAYLLFTVIPNKKISALLLGVITLSLSAFQKVFVLTVLFGNTLWESIDTFGNYVSSELFWINGDTNFQLSYVLIGVYGTIHLLGGIIFGLIAGKTPKWISENSDKVYEYNEQFHHKDEILDLQKKKKKNVWWKRKSTLIIGLFSLTMVIISYLNPELGDNLAFQIVIMLVRSIVITYVWFGLISPILIRWVKKYLLKKKSEYSKEINEILALFPYFKGIINYSWRKTNHKKNYKRILPFLTNSFLLLLMADINLNEKDNPV